MKTISVILLLLGGLAVPQYCLGQASISYDYMPGSSLRDESGNKYGSGSMMVVSGRYNLPISVKHDEKGRLVAWSATLNGAYGTLDNKGQARELNPDKIVNASLNISHVRPLSDRWSIIASIGGGIYAPQHEVTAKSVLANGGVIFALCRGTDKDCRFKQRYAYGLMDVGSGAEECGWDLQ